MIAYGIYWLSIQAASEMLRQRIVESEWRAWLAVAA